MSYNFGGQITRSLSSSAPSISSYPSTLSLWFNVSSTTISQLLTWFTWADSSTYSIVRMVSALSAGRIVTITPLTSTLFISTTTTYTVNTWNHLCIVLLNSTSRTIYLNGGGSSTITSSADISGMNNIRIGCSINQTTGANTGTTFGRISDVGLWSTDLNTDEIRSLSKGFSAKKIRPQSLEYYAPLTRDLIEYNGGLTITNNGSTPVADNQRIYL